MFIEISHLLNYFSYIFYTNNLWMKSCALQRRSRFFYVIFSLFKKMRKKNLETFKTCEKVSSIGVNKKDWNSLKITAFNNILRGTNSINARAGDECLLKISDSEISTKKYLMLLSPLANYNLWRAQWNIMSDPHVQQQQCREGIIGHIKKFKHAWINHSRCLLNLFVR